MTIGMIVYTQHNRMLKGINMKRTCKKALAISLAVIMVFGVMPVTALTTRIVLFGWIWY